VGGWLQRRPTSGFTAGVADNDALSVL